MSSKILIFISFFISFASAASPYKIDHLEPPFWWAGMADERLQILVHGERISELVPEISYRELLLLGLIRLKAQTTFSSISSCRVL